MTARTEEAAGSIPELTNIAILAVSLPVGWLCLWVASHWGWLWALVAAGGFAVVNNTPFCLMHEAVHGVLSRKRLLNEILGTAAAATFPTSLSLQRIAHLGHHRRNRTDAEVYDYYLPGQSRALRNLQLYAGNLGGCYWACIPLSNLVYLLAPWFYGSEKFISGPARHLGFEAYVREIAVGPRLKIWFECLLALIYQVVIWWLLDLSWQGWLLCYWAFALHWSALQYVDHAWSPRDVTNGAWNLRVSRLARAFALNYHYHLAHHRYPTTPWIHLPNLVDPSEPQPTFWSIYFSLWGGTRPAPPMGSPATI